MSAGRQTVVIGLDGVPPWLIDMLTEEGALPHIAELRERGVMGAMRSTINMLTGSAWPSMFTGVNPGRHGMFDFVQYAPEEHDIYLINGLNRRAGSIWELLGAHDKRSAILRVPMTFPTTPMEGITVGDHFAPSPKHPEFTWPRELRTELVRTFGRLGWGTKADMTAVTTNSRLRRLIGDLTEGVTRSFDLIDWALDRDRFDLVFAVVSETDTCLHALMPLLRPDEVSATRFPSFPPAARDTLVGLFREVDRRVGTLLERLGDGWNVLIVSDHGMGPNDPAAQLLRPVLLALGYQGWRDPPPPPTAGPGLMPLLRKIKSGIARHIPWQIRRMIDPISHERREAGARKDIMQVIDWARTTAFTVVPGGGVGEVWLNLKGRSPHGTVDPADRDALVEELSRALLSVRNARTGERQVERIIPREEAVSGAYSDLVPDLLVMFREDQDCVAVHVEGPDGETIELDRSSTGGWGIEHFGYHEHDGLIMAAGPDIRSRQDPVTCDIADVMPTLAYLLGCPIPDGLDARLLDEIIEPDLLARRPPVIGDALPPPPWSDEDGQYSDGDEEKVGQRLKDLGYI